MADAPDHVGVPFNMANLFYIELDLIIKHYIEYMINDDYFNAFDCLSVMYGHIEFKLTPDEIARINALQDQGKKTLLVLQNNTHARNNGSEGRLKTICENLNIELRRCMNRHHMMFQKPDTVGLDKIRQSYGMKDDTN